MGVASKVREVVPQCETCGAEMVPMVSSYFCPKEDEHVVPWQREYFGGWCSAKMDELHRKLEELQQKQAYPLIWVQGDDDDQGDL